MRRCSAAARLVTLTGAGGSGKTRLAIEVAARTVEQTRDGAWLVDLAPVFDPELVVKAVARVLGVRERPHSDLLDDVLERLRESELLLVLDNCEHLVEACARLAEDLLRGCPELRLLATSREPLGVPGERVFRTGSLLVPAGGDASDAIAARPRGDPLRRSRRRRALGGFELTPDTAPVVGQVCRRLDGLPLAIELAAARTASLSLDDLGSRLDDCFALLTGGARTALPRQRTLEATVAWSYDLLSERQRALFDRLSVFAGGWTLDAAETVCASAGLEARHVADDLAALVDKSLVVRDAPGSGRSRYRLLETLRQYGRDRLREAGRAAAVRDAHLSWAVGLAEEAEQHLEGLDQAAWLDVLESELDNLRGALEWAITSRNPEAGLRLASITTGSLWTWRSHVPEGQRWLQRLLDDTRRDRRRRAGQGTHGRRASRLPRRPVATRNGPVRAESRPVPGGGGRSRRGAGAHLAGVQPLGDRGRRRDRRHPRGRHRRGATRGAAAGDRDRARTERDLVVAARPPVTPTSWWRKAGS